MLFPFMAIQNSACVISLQVISTSPAVPLHNVQTTYLWSFEGGLLSYCGRKLLRYIEALPNKVSVVHTAILRDIAALLFEFFK